MRPNSRQAADTDVVIALGGDGTVNEIVNGLAGQDVPLAILPGRSTGVIARNLGIPADVRTAAERLRD